MNTPLEALADKMRTEWTVEDFKRVYLKFFNGVILLDFEFQRKFPKEYLEFILKEGLE